MSTLKMNCEQRQTGRRRWSQAALTRRCWIAGTLLGLGGAQAQDLPVPYNCSVVLPSSLDFGPYRYAQGVTLASSLSVSCSAEGPARPLTVLLGSNLYRQGRPPTLSRRNDQLRYELFVGQSRVPFGAAALPLTFDFAGTGRPAPLNVPLLGQIPAGQWKPAGQYQGQLEVTLDFVPLP